MARETELLVLNSICKTKNIQSVLSETTVSELFSSNSDVWDWMRDYYLRYRQVPSTTLVKDKFPHFEVIDVDGDPRYYVDNLRAEHINSELEELTLLMRQRVGVWDYNKIISGVSEKLGRLQGLSTKSQDLDITDFDKAAEDYKETRLKAEAMGGVPGIPTGISIIDSAYTTGLVGGDLIVVLGWTGRGKSIVTTLICVNAFLSGFKPMIVSLEMNAAKVRDRAYTMMGSGKFKNSDLSVGDVQEDDFRSWSQTIEGPGFVIVSHDGNDEVTPAAVQSKIDRYSPDIIVLDYAQLMSDNANSSDMVSRMRNMSKEYKRLATANNIPIILISSATPDSASSVNTPPIIEQVAWSKQLSFDADLAFAVHRVEGSNDGDSVMLELAGRKNRNGDLFNGLFKADINRGLYEEVLTQTE